MDRDPRVPWERVDVDLEPTWLTVGDGRVIELLALLFDGPDKRGGQIHGLSSRSELDEHGRGLFGLIDGNLCSSGI
jgi:hypothetical protein